MVQGGGGKAKWWPVLLGPVAMGAVYGAHGAGREVFYDKQIHETLALIILGLAVVSYGACGARGRRPIHLILAVFTTALFCREWHFAGSGIGVYVAGVLILGWGYLWRERLRPCWREEPFRWWLTGTLATYLLSVLISRRVFRHLLPLEKELHVPLEEVTETTAHLMMLVTSLVAWTLLQSKEGAATPRASTGGE